MNQHSNCFLFACIIGISGLVVGDAHAEEGDSQRIALEEIVVTAERRTEASQDVPISMSVFSGEFANKYVNSGFDIAEFVPNFQNTTNGSGTSLVFNRATIRGLGSSDQANPLAATSVVTYYDGLATGTPLTAVIPQWDLDRIEVQRGPQGTLSGRNAVGGVVQYISAKPTDDFEAYSEFSVGEFDLVGMKGAVSGPITDTLRARVSGVIHNRGGDVTNTFNGTKQGEQNWWGAKAIVEWQLSDRFQIVGIAQHFDADVDFFAWNVLPSDSFPTSFTQWLGATNADPDNQWQSNFEEMQSPLVDPFEKTDSDIFELNAFYDFGGVSLTAIFGYIDTNNSSNFAEPTYPDQITDQVSFADVEQLSAEVRLTSQTDGSLSWIAGAYLQRTEDFFSITADLTGLLRDLDGDGLTRHNADSPEDLLDGIIAEFAFSNVVLEGGTDQELDTYALFLHTTYDWTDRLTTTHAVRYTDEKKAVDIRFNSFFEIPVSFGVIPGTVAQHNDLISFAYLNPTQQRLASVSIIADPNTLDGGGNVVPFRASKSSDEFTWNLGIDYRMRDDLLIYGSISKGFRGSIFPLLSTPATATSADPETSIVYEVGVKGQWLDNRLQVNTSVFFNDHRDFQTTLRNFLPDSSIVFLVDNIPESTIYGGELEVSAVLFENLLLIANFGFLDTEIKKASLGNEELVGNELPWVEDKNFSGRLVYTAPLSIGTISPEVAWNYKGKYWSLKDNNDIVIPGDYWTYDLRIGYESPNEKVYGAVYLKNILDEVHTVNNAVPLADSFPTTNSFINERRHWGLTVGYRF